MSGDALIAAIAGVLGAGAGAAATGFTSLRSARNDRRNSWMEFKRGNSNSFMQHIAVHNEEEPLDENDRRLLGHYYLLALAVGEDEAAHALYEALPSHLQQRAHDPKEPPFSNLRAEVTPRRRNSAPPPGGEN